MNMDKESLIVTQNIEKNRFEIQIEEAFAIAEYMITGGKLALTHTEVPVAFEGNGIGGVLAKYAFQYAKDNDLKVLPLCPYMSAYVKRHPEVREVVLEHLR